MNCWSTATFLASVGFSICILGYIIFDPIQFWFVGLEAQVGRPPAFLGSRGAQPHIISNSISWLIPAEFDFTSPSLGQLSSTPTVVSRGCPTDENVLCEVPHVFAEVVIITLPRRRAKWQRLSTQLIAHNIPHKLVHAYDGYSTAFQNLYKRFMTPSQQKQVGKKLAPTEIALMMTHLDLLDYFRRSPHETILVFEDDALLHKNFSVEFSRQMRLVQKIQPDWKQLLLGATIPSTNMKPGNESWLWSPEGFNVNRHQQHLPGVPFSIKSAWGAFAVAWHRSAVDEMIELQASFSQPLDNWAQPKIAKGYPNRTLVFSPYLVIPDTRTSDLRPGTSNNKGVKLFFQDCGFDIEPYHHDEANVTLEFVYNLVTNLHR